MILKISDFADVMLEAVKNGQDFVLPLHGTSMNPFFHTGDQAVINAPVDVKVGDALLFIRPDGSYVFHRLYKIKKGLYYMVGDNQTYFEIIDPSSVLAKMNAFIIDGKVTNAKNKKYRFKVWLWRCFLFRKIYHLFKYHIFKNKGEK